MKSWLECKYLYDLFVSITPFPDWNASVVGAAGLWRVMNRRRNQNYENTVSWSKEKKKFYLVSSFSLKLWFSLCHDLFKFSIWIFSGVCEVDRVTSPSTGFLAATVHSTVQYTVHPYIIKRTVPNSNEIFRITEDAFLHRQMWFWPQKKIQHPKCNVTFPTPTLYLSKYLHLQ